MRLRGVAFVPSRLHIGTGGVGHGTSPLQTERAARWIGRLLGLLGLGVSFGYLRLNFTVASPTGKGFSTRTTIRTTIMRLNRLAKAVMAFIENLGGL
jgi:hypothetical protein